MLAGVGGVVDDERPRRVEGDAVGLPLWLEVDAQTLEYEFTMEDPGMFTRPWTAAIPLTTDQGARGVTSGPLYEYACHEGNYAMTNTLTGARATDGVIEAGDAR